MSDRVALLVSCDMIACRACRIIWLAGIVSRIEPVACRISAGCMECGIECDAENG